MELQEMPEHYSAQKLLSFYIIITITIIFLTIDVFFDNQCLVHSELDLTKTRAIVCGTLFQRNCATFEQVKYRKYQTSIFPSKQHI